MNGVTAARDENRLRARAWRRQRSRSRARPRARAWPLFVASLSPYVLDLPKVYAYAFVMTVMLTLTAMSLLFTDVPGRRRLTRTSWHFWAFVGLIGVTQFVGTATGDLTEFGALRALLYVVGLVCTYFVVSTAFQFGWRYDLRVVAWTGGLCALIALAVSLGGDTSVLGINLRRAPYTIPILGLHPSAGPFADENYFAVVILVATIATVYLRQTSSTGLGRRLYTGWLLVLGVGLLLSYSRAGFLALSAAGVLWVSVGRPGRTALIAATIMLLVVWLALIPAVDDRIGAFLQLDRALSGREDLWTMTIARISERPWSGWGVGNVSGVIQLDSRWTSSHNTLLDFMIMTGVFGGLAYVYFVLASLRPSLRFAATSIEARFVLCAGVGILLVAQFTTHTIGGLSFGSLMLTALLGVANDWRDRSSAELPTRYGLR